MRYLLDTNVCVDYLTGRFPSLTKRWQQTRPREVCISSIVLAELVFGMEKSRQRARNRSALESLTSELSCLPFDAEAATAYGRVRIELERSGKTIGANDLLIGSHALAAGLILVTDKVREFGRISALEIENWRNE